MGAWLAAGLGAGLLAAAVLEPLAHYLAQEGALPYGHCPHCGASRSHIAFVPFIGRTRLGGCPSCGTQPGGLAFDFFALLGTAALFMLVPWPGLLRALLVLWLGLVAAAVDLRRRLIPNRLLLAAGALGLAALAPLGPQAYVTGLAGGLLLLAVGLLIAWLGHGGFGLGDVKYLALLGLLLGWRGGLATLVLAVLAGGIYAAWLLATRRAARGDAFAFGPFIALGSAAVLLLAARVPH